MDQKTGYVLQAVDLVVVLTSIASDVLWFWRRRWVWLIVDESTFWRVGDAGWLISSHGRGGSDG